ncbi:protein-disulfide reductase DsbD domain-containing protein [Fluviicola sp.]|uniref:protein-disulfide reductase DsbD domain-containing protein n=1 Tax=Fluviicola sp. TaxID=1917219 RepID=UPI0028194292|nr:protein-disulfide reductase DsbD domain-containing protein [Fluviicola sp.]MDR0801154.1 protein-disulfide reductase DsbD N-terminal domain-containing protein [Fluviicola sp.]
MIYKLFFLCSFLMINTMLFSQDRVKWNFSYNPATQEIQMKASIAEGWHLYSQHINNTIGPVPTSFTFTENPNVKFEGEVTEPKAIHEYDENFEAALDFFKNEVIFTRKISKTKAGETIKGYVTFMVCNDVMCLPPVDIDFSITIQ